MQQATNPTGKPLPNNGQFVPSSAPVTSPRFVINLCASTTPVGLVQPTHAGLKRFTFFVSRRLEEGRERFRLHMGYFESQEEAEKILDLVRDVYPAAWAGVAPGIKLRARAAEAAAAPAPAAPVASAPLPAAPVPAAPVAAAPLPAAPVPAAPVAAAPLPAAPVPAAPQGPAPVVPQGTLTGPPAHVPTLAAAAPHADADAGAAARSLDNIRATIDSLDDEAPGVPAPGSAEPPLDAPAVLRLLESERPAVAASPQVSSPARAATPRPTTPPQAAPRPTPAPKSAPTPARPPMASAATLRRAVAPPRVAQVTPPLNEPAVYAVQLLWSVQAIDMNQVPQLAIFSAYTLYGAEGNRDGRRWYGLRLGFFTDAVSAKQVAQYVRSEFTSVSVVPVTHRERERAGAATAKPLPAVSTEKRSGIELNFIEDVPTDTATSGARPALRQAEAEAAPAAPEAAQSPETRATLNGGAGAALPPGDARARAAAAVGMTTRATPGKRAKLRVAQGLKPAPKRPVDGRPLSLEETLEVLGAGQLQIDNGRGEFLNDAAQRDRKAAAPSGSRFGRLINRLAERLGNG